MPYHDTMIHVCIHAELQYQLPDANIDNVAAHTQRYYNNAYNSSI